MDLVFTYPMDLHCEYSIDQIMAAFGYFTEEFKPSFREGVKYFRDKKLDAFFITLNKSEKDFSPSTLYEDYAINKSCLICTVRAEFLRRVRQGRGT